MKCLVCKKKIDTDYQGFVDDGVNIELSFGFNSKFSDVKDTFQFEMIDYMNTPSKENRAVALASCLVVRGCICDECFEQNSECFIGVNITHKEPDTEIIVNED